MRALLKYGKASASRPDMSRIRRDKSRRRHRSEQGRHYKVDTFSCKLQLTEKKTRSLENILKPVQEEYKFRSIPRSRSRGRSNRQSKSYNNNMHRGDDADYVNYPVGSDSQTRTSPEKTRYRDTLSGKTKSYQPNEANEENIKASHLHGNAVESLKVQSSSKLQDNQSNYVNISVGCGSWNKNKPEKPKDSKTLDWSYQANEAFNLVDEKKNIPQSVYPKQKGVVLSNPEENFSL